MQHEAADRPRLRRVPQQSRSRDRVEKILDTAAEQVVAHGVEAVGVDADLAEHAAEVLEHTRNAHLWRWAIPESVAALAGLADAGVPMGVVSNASGQIEACLHIVRMCSEAFP